MQLSTHYQQHVNTLHIKVTPPFPPKGGHQAYMLNITQAQVCKHVNVQQLHSVGEGAYPTLKAQIIQSIPVDLCMDEIQDKMSMHNPLTWQ